MVVFCAGIVNALDVDSYKIIARPVDLEYVENIVEIGLYNDGDVSVNNSEINLAIDSEIISLMDSYGELSYSIEKGDKLRLKFDFSVPIEAGSSRTLIIKTETSSNLFDKGNYFEYVVVLNPSSSIDDFEHVLLLPKDIFLYVEGDVQLVVPDAEISVLDEGLQIKWDMEIDESTVFLARFKQTEGVNYFYYVLGVVLVLVIGVLIGYVFNWLYYSKKKKDALKAADILNEREKAVLRLVIEKPGIKNSEVRKELEYTKSSLSKIVSKLEFRGLIKSKKFGKIKELYLGERMEGKV